MFKYFTLNNFKFKDKIVGVRVDINSPTIDGKIAMNERIKSSAKTLKELSKDGAKVVVLAHQGRKGKSDCVSLREHAKLLEKEIGSKVDFISDIFSKEVEKKICSMKNGDILVLENLRFYDDEKDIKKKGNLILKLENLFDFYVFDAFSVSHREQTSVIGFNKIPMIAGRTMEKELFGLNEILDTKAPHDLFFGGAKPDDLVILIENSLKVGKADQIFLTGVIGEIALHIKGYYLGKKLDFMKEHEFLNSVDKVKELLNIYPDKIVIPKDVAVNKDGKRIEINVEDLDKNKDLLDNYLIQDIGKKTIDYYSLFLKKAGSVYVKGPAGNFELKGFEKGTKGIFKEITSIDAFSFMGGGHSVTAADNLGFMNKFSYVSLAGGALVKFLSGEKLPGVEALQSSYNKFEKVYEDFIVVGSNTIDIGVSVPKMFNEVSLGDKVKVKEDFKTTVGGGGINVSICLARLGAKVGYLGKLSFESLDKVKEVLNKNKVNLIESKVSKKAAAKSVLLDTLDGDRVIYTYRGQNSYFNQKDFDVDSFRSNFYYFNSLTGDGFSTLFDLAKKIRKRNNNAVICYNPGTYLIGNEPRLKNLIKNVDILVLNYDEAQYLVGDGSVSSCLRKIGSLVRKFVVITDGSNGSYLYDGNNEYFMSAIKPKKIVDATGAGDSYAATLFYFYSKGYGIKKAMKYASINASNVLTKKGAQDGLLFYDDLVN